MRTTTGTRILIGLTAALVTMTTLGLLAGERFFQLLPPHSQVSLLLYPPNRTARWRATS